MEINDLGFRLKNGTEIIPYAMFVGAEHSTISRFQITNENEGSVFPQTEFILAYDAESIKLLESQFVLEEKDIPYSDEKFIRIIRKVQSSGESLTYDFATKTLKASDGFFNVFNGTNISINNACEFFATVSSELNPIVYQLFTKITPALKSFKCYHAEARQNTIKHLFECITNLNALEKIIKTLGAKWVLTNIANENFDINTEKRKLTQIVQAPMEVLKTLKTLKLEGFSVIFTELASVDPNYAILLSRHLKDLKKIFGTTSKAGLTYIDKSIQTLTKILATGDYEFNSLMNYLYRESARYSFSSRYLGPRFPTEQIKELWDYISYAKSIKDCRYDKLPKNLNLAFFILRRNAIILQTPRPEEFEAAVNKYKDLEWKNKDYIFRTPIDEADLFNEGNKLCHCVAGYRDNIINGCSVIFMRKIEVPEEPFVTIEYDRGAILQAKQKFNIDVEDVNALVGIGKWCDAIERRLKNNG